MSLNETENEISKTEYKQKFQENSEKPSDIERLLDNKKLIHTLRSISNPLDLKNDLLTNDEIRNLPILFINLHDALKKSNSNVLDLKNTISELLDKELRLRTKLKNMKLECDAMKNANLKFSERDIEIKSKLEKVTNENFLLQEEINGLLNSKSNSEELNIGLRNLRKKYEDLEKKYNFNLKELNLKDKMINEMNGVINNYKKTLNDLNIKNQKYVMNNNLLQNEISNIGEKFDEFKVFKNEISDLILEINELKSHINELEEERQKSSLFSDNLNKENNKLKEKNLKLKEDLKYELTEKIKILKELEIAKDSQRIVSNKQESLKNIVEMTTNEKEKIIMRASQLENEINSYKKLLKVKDEEISELKRSCNDLKNKYMSMMSNFDELQKNFEKVEEKLNTEKNFDNNEKIQEKIFLLTCEVNLWKNAFSEIVRHKQFNFDENLASQKIEIDRNYIENSPLNLREAIDDILSFFKNSIEDENYQAINIGTLKDALLQEQEKSIYLKNCLVNELNLRRKIHNRYMFLRGNLRIMCRVRPFLQSENSLLIKKRFLESYKISNENIVISDENKKDKKYRLDYIFGQKSNQQEVYDEVSLLIQSLQKGTNICIIAYGQTNTGKTYTIQGPKDNPGICFRSAQEIFDLIEFLNMRSKNNTKTKLSLSIIEIYNENIYNLLDDSIPSLNIYENSNGNLMIPDLKPVTINSINEAVKLIKLSSKIRHTNSTQYNDRSSRSHCVYSFQLKIMEGDNIIRSKLNIIDLAGSERLSKSNIKIEGNLKKETISINLSLSALANVLNSIAIGSNHIPYRDSKLTHYLKESLGENFNILLLLHVSPNTRDIGETNSTLEFGSRIAKVCKHKIGKEKMASFKD